MTDEAENRWIRSQGYELPDGTEVTLTYAAVNIADLIGMRFREVDVTQLEYPGHLQDAAVTIWLADLASEDDGGKLLRSAHRAAMADRAGAIEMALEWWQEWFIENDWRPNGEEHFKAIILASEMWGDILGAETTPMVEETGGGEGSSLGKS
jgi:hypothetical protein